MHDGVLTIRSKPQRIAPAIETKNDGGTATQITCSKPQRIAPAIETSAPTGLEVRSTDGSKPQRIAPAIETVVSTPEINIFFTLKAPKNRACD